MEDLCRTSTTVSLTPKQLEYSYPELADADVYYSSDGASVRASDSVHVQRDFTGYGSFLSF